MRAGLLAERARGDPPAAAFGVRRAGDVAVAAYAGFYGPDLAGYETPLRDIAGRMRAADVLVAVVDGAIVGTVTYVADASSPFAEHQRHGEASIRMLAVLPAHSRHGIGRALSLACIDRARAEGKRAVILHADEGMAASRALYEGLGFRRDPGRDYRPDRVTFLVAYELEL